jgi:transcription-repair coupling factor (superfamily II helicase)
MNRLLDSPAVHALCNDVEAAANARVVAEGSQGSSATLLTAALALRTKRPVLMVVAHLDDADDVLDDLELLRSAGFVLPASRFGALEVLPGETAVSLELLAERLQVVARLLESPAGQSPHIIVAPVQALMQAVPKLSELGGLARTVRRGEAMPQSELFDWLTQSGYQRVDAIEHPGEFAARGGIVDIYAPVSTHPDAGDDPIRLDYFGDDVDAIFRVDPDTMGSGSQLDEVRIIGAQAKAVQSDDAATSFLSLLPNDALVVMHEAMELSEQARGYYERLTNPIGIYSPQAVFKAIAGRRHVEINQYSTTLDPQRGHMLPLSPLPTFDQDAAKAIKELGALATSGEHEQVVVLCANQGEHDRLVELIGEFARDAKDAITVELGYLHRGFVWGEHGKSLVLTPHQELFHRYDVRRRIRRIGVTSSESGRAADAFLEIEVGDYVVHADHGIARFIGLRSMEREGRTDEFLTLEFDGKAHLHVPATQIDLVQKYVGGFHGRPPLSKLGGKRWTKQKEQTAEAVRDLAAELLRIQAARASMPGVRYPADTAWQNEFEAEFPFQETPDQLATLTEVKKDMADDQPMDRLVCGDVGFGKTEIAIRAAFKAVEYGKQVAVLVPTTVLAEQHERTFGSRMRDYPFRVESISRFKTAGEVKKVLGKLKRGEVDVIIGTHRLLSKDVRFADLGLVIIDEEQRFGVEHKSKLLQLRLTADVMTLSATPIPRTLHMSMLGLRDISSLSTPPMDRRAIVTEVIPFDRHRVKSAIIRELNRDGQIYFLHNRVHNIQSVASEIHQLVPEARIAIGHGQMPGKELEKVMLRFVRREADILVCTTIIESGLDIPTANTIFINRSDNFGLADLHQLRGRVGRYKHRAYCYLLLPEDRPITDKAARRLKAIEQYSMLGAGFKIAMRDLEIRGAGNLLGAEQSGHIAAVGYDMYCRLLEKETKRLRNETIIEPIKTHLELPIAGQIPKSYIRSDKFRMEAYRRLSRSVSFEELEAVVKDMIDAYGEPPTGAQALIDLTELRIAASHLEVRVLKLDGPDLIFRCEHPRNLDPYLKDAPGRASVIDERTVYYRPPVKYLKPPSTLLAILRKMLVRPMTAALSPSP